MDNNFTPPCRNSKSLGIRRSITKNQSIKTPLSDIKKNNIIQYLKEEQLESPKTPVSGFKTLGISSRSRNSNSYKLSLSRSFEERHKKKKLVFSTQVSNESTEIDVSSLESSPLRRLPQSPVQSKSLVNIESNSSDLQQINYESMKEDDLKNEIERKLRILENLRKHEQKVDELRKIIEIWKRGFQASIADMKNTFESHDSESLLEQLHLPKGLIKYCQ